MKFLTFSLAPYRFATRPRKAAVEYRIIGESRFVSLRAMGRTGFVTDAEEFVSEDGVIVETLASRNPRQGTSTADKVSNLVLGYLPGMLKLMWVAGTRSADVVHVTGSQFILLGVIHKVRFGSRFVLDINERPASFSHSGSLASSFARVEPRLLRIGRRFADVVSVVTPGHVDLLERDHGYRGVRVVRNVPSANWRAPYSAITKASDDPLKLTLISTLFEHRGLEIAIDAIARLVHEGVAVELSIFGTGRPDYTQGLQERINSLGVAGSIFLSGRVERDHVSATYLAGHVGLAIYEPEDLHNDSLSNKLLECLSSGRPVIAGNLPENSRFLSAHPGVGWLCDVSVDGLYEAVREVVDTDWAELRRMGDMARSLGDDSLTWESEFRSSIFQALAPGAPDGVTNT